jgi:ArsR family transcriptional regulator
MYWYNIFDISNMKKNDSLNQISVILKTISHPSRLAILLAIGEGEVCVCHLEKMLGMSQSHISQQLMILREVGIVLPRRDYRYIHYKLVYPKLLGLIGGIAGIYGIALPEFHAPNNCDCSKCSKNK